MATDSWTQQPDWGVVFVHGAGLDTWIWEEVASALDAAHLAVAFPPEDDRATFGLAGYVDHVRRQIDEWSVGQVTIVAHSIGSVVGLDVAKELPDRVAGFVGVSAAIPKPGGSFLSCYPVHQRLIRHVVMRLAGTKPPDGAIRKSLCNGLSDAQADRVVEQFRPESRRLYTDESSAEIPDVPSLYVKTMDDNELSRSMQDAMVATIQPDDVATIDAGHMPMLSHPDELAGLLNEFDES